MAWQLFVGLIMVVIAALLFVLGFIAVEGVGYVVVGAIVLIIGLILVGYFFRQRWYPVRIGPGVMPGTPSSFFATPESSTLYSR